MKVKICGITNVKDARAAVRAGADALGFVFAESARRVDPRAVRAIVAEVGPLVTVVGVFVNAPAETILDTAAQCRLDVLQLHGEESPEFCRRLAPYKIIKTFRVGELFSPAAAKPYEADAYMFETADTQRRGGTGRTWAWEKLPRTKIKKPFIVTGGLTPRNVATAVKILKPYAVDVSSGVESKPGVKNAALMEEFVRNAKKA